MKALEETVPTLNEFMKIVQRYSTSDATIYRVLIDLHLALVQLRKGEDTAVKARKRSFKLAVDKLQKYVDRYLANNGISVAFVLDPRSREKGLANLFSAYNMSRRLSEVVNWIRARASLEKKPEDETPEERTREKTRSAREDFPEPLEADRSDEEEDEDSSLDLWDFCNASNPKAKGLKRQAEDTV